MLIFFYFLCLFSLQKSSSSESLSEKASSELKKSFDAVVFDVLKVTPEEYAVSGGLHLHMWLCQNGSGGDGMVEQEKGVGEH